ncbi:Hypothetical phage protein, partial [Bordetella avium 197N]
VMGKDFIPRPACTVASGDCLYAGRCLLQCTTRLTAAAANEKLTEALALLSKLREYTISFRSVTLYVDGSEIDAAVRKAGQLLNASRRSAAPSIQGEGR